MSNIQQLVKKDRLGGHSNVTPKTSIDAIDGLKEILQNYNMYFLPYTGSRETTRLQVPMELRKEGLWITYVGYHNNVITEWYNGQSVDDTSFKDSKNWRIGSNALVGDLSISSNGNWVINGDESNFPARGETGVTPILRMEPNTKTIQVTYNEGRLWEDVSERLTTFIPHMTLNGDLTWTNSAGLENPNKINLMGPSGVTLPSENVVVQQSGDGEGSELKIMSLKAVTEELKDIYKQITEDEKSSTDIIRTNELDNVPEVIHRAVLKNYIYVNTGGTTVGQMLCFTEGTGKVYTQVLFTHYKPNVSGVFSDIDYDKVHIYKRSYYKEVHETHKIGWTKWEDVRAKELEEINISINSVLKKVERNSSDLHGTEVDLSANSWKSGFIQTRVPAENNSPVSKDPTPNPEGFNWKSVEVKALEGDKFMIHAVGGVEARAWNFLNSKRIVLTLSGSAETVTGEIIAPKGTASLLLNSNSNDCYVRGGNKPVWAKKKIKILLFGNSFTRDSFSYVPAVMKLINPDVDLKIAIAYIGGSSLAQHLASFTGKPLTVAGTTYNPRNYDVTISENGNPWSKVISMNANSVLLSDKWDIITFQQNGQGAYQNYDVYYKPFIYPLLDNLYSKLTYNIKIGWVLIHGSYGNSKEQFYEHWKGNSENALKLISTTETSIIFPYGTAIENLRTTECFNLGDGSAHGMTADNAHLLEGIGCLCAAYSNCLTILNALGINYIGVTGNSINIDKKFIEDNNVPEPNFGTSNSVVGITKSNLHLALISAENAVKYPYMVTDLVNKKYKKLDFIGSIYDLLKLIDSITTKMLLN